MIGLLAFVAAATVDPQAAAAFKAAFGKGGSVTLLKQGEMQESVRYTPGQLVIAPFGPVLIAPGKVLEPAHVSSGKLAAIYLKRTGSGFAVLKRFVPAIESGSFGQLGDWRVSRAYGPLPIVEVEGGGTWQGYTCSVTTLLELEPSGPRELVTIPLYYDDASAVTGRQKPTTIRGRIMHIVAGKSFDVAYSGSQRFTEKYVRRGNAYLLAGGGETKMQTC